MSPPCIKACMIALTFWQLPLQYRSVAGFRLLLFFRNPTWRLSRPDRPMYPAQSQLARAYRPSIHPTVQLVSVLVPKRRNDEPPTHPHPDRLSAAIDPG